jgi:hypothetical protein
MHPNAVPNHRLLATTMIVTVVAEVDDDLL